MLEQLAYNFLATSYSLVQRYMTVGEIEDTVRRNRKLPSHVITWPIFNHDIHLQNMSLGGRNLVETNQRNLCALNLKVGTLRHDVLDQSGLSASKCKAKEIQSNGSQKIAIYHCETNAIALNTAGRTQQIDIFHERDGLKLFIDNLENIERFNLVAPGAPASKNKNIAFLPVNPEEGGHRYLATDGHNIAYGQLVGTRDDFKDLRDSTLSDLEQYKKVLKLTR